MGSDCVEVERAAWIRRSTIQEAACLTFVRDADVDRVARAFGAVTEQARLLDIDEFCEEAFARQERYPMIAVRRLGDRLLVVEDGGRQGRRPEVLRRVSADTAVVSAFWDIDRLTRFSYAVDGVVRTSFEAVLPEYREGADPDALEAERAGLPWCDSDPVVLMLALAGRITGITPSPGWLAGEFVTYPVAEWPDDLVAVPDPLDNVVGYPPELAPAVRAGDRRSWRRAAVAVARHVLSLVGCLEHPVVRRTLSSMSLGRRVDEGKLSEMVREWSWRSLMHRPCSKVRDQFRAVQVLRQATHADPLTAVLAALAEARHVRGVEQGDLAHVARCALGGR